LQQKKKSFGLEASADSDNGSCLETQSCESPNANSNLKTEICIFFIKSKLDMLLYLQQ
jgi:hypothetical protein